MRVDGAAMPEETHFQLFWPGQPVRGHWFMQRRSCGEANGIGTPSVLRTLARQYNNLAFGNTSAHLVAGDSARAAVIVLEEATE